MPANEQFPTSATLDDIRGVFSSLGCERLFVKELAWNHDSKRQVYLTTTPSIFNLLPCEIQEAPPMPLGLQPSQKPKAAGADRIFGHLSFYWVSLTGSSDHAKDAKLIYYPQYPEVRLSGFLRGTSTVPSRFLREKSGEVYSNRLLFFAPRNDGRVFAFLAVNLSDLRDEVRSEPRYDLDAGFNEIRLRVHVPSAKDELVTRLLAIHNKGWIDGQRLTPNGVVACSSPNAVGYTLEAELGVMPNGDNAPDFRGWEVKAMTVPAFDRIDAKVVTVFTPEPDCGVYADESVVAFLTRWGYADQLGRDDRRNFGGVHRVGETHDGTGLTLRLVGYDPDTPDRMSADGLVGLYDDDVLAAGWTYRKLIDTWRRKHARAAYVPALKRDDPKSFRFGSDVSMCEGTDFLYVLAAMVKGWLYLDPAIKGEKWSTGQPKVKRRNQFRIKAVYLPRLYDSSDVVNLLTHR